MIGVFDHQDVGLGYEGIERWVQVTNCVHWLSYGLCFGAFPPSTRMILEC